MSTGPSRLEEKSAELASTAEKLREANDKLTQISLQKDAFLSQISHELRTPMTSIRAFSEILRDVEVKDGPDGPQHAAIIHAEAVRLTRLLDDLLDLSVLENGQVNLTLQDAALHDLLDQAVTTALAGGQALKVTRDRSSEQDLLHTDPDRLAQVFINLITNARKYCDARSPELTIRVHRDRDRIRIDFADNGSGIPASERMLIFEKFARRSAHKGSGAGLGLAICRELMQRLGGQIDYVPSATGTVFRVTLPRRRAMAAQ